MGPVASSTRSSLELVACRVSTVLICSSRVGAWAVSNLSRKAALTIILETFHQKRLVKIQNAISASKNVKMVQRVASYHASMHSIVPVSSTG